jgi:hypothetical protein
VKVEPDKKSLKIPKGGNQNLYIEEEQTTQCSKEKVLKDKQGSTKHTYKTKDQVTFMVVIIMVVGYTTTYAISGYH